MAVGVAFATILSHPVLAEMVGNKRSRQFLHESIQEARSHKR
jgi:hypothetical protein